MELGRTLADRFEIERLAGSGGMGRVFKARDTLSGRPVALKVLHAQGPLESERFAREAEVLSGLAHPAIVRFVAHGYTEEGEPWLAIEWLDGEDLGARLKRTGLSVAETLALGARVADALGEAHRRGVVHRDVKPGNIWLVDGKPEEAKILDFGIARMRASGERTLTQAGAMIGTPGYMAPEQARGERRVDARADVFSLGCVLFKCVTGRLPFEGGDVMAVLLKLVLEDAPRLGDLRPGVPLPLEDLVARMLAKEAEDRPADGGEVAAAVAGIEPGAPLGELRVARADVNALTGTERPVICVVLARLEEPSPPASPDDDATVITLEASRRSLGTALDALGGKLSVLADGSLVVMVPQSGAFTDQAARAARSALAVRARHPGAAVAVIAGRGELSARLPMGEVIDRGVDLLKRAAAGTIRLDEGIAGLVASTFEVSGDEAGLLLLGERGAEVKRTLLGKETPFVGREREAMTLEAVFDEVAGEQVARAVLVTAPAGVGKSRLRQELIRRVRAKAAEQRGDLAAARATTGLSDPPPRAVEGAFELWLGRGDPMRKGSPFGLVAPLIKRLAGVLDGEPVEVRRKKLSARLGRTLGGGDRVRVSAFLGEMAGVPFPDEESVELRAARQDAQLMGDQMRRAFEDLLAAECAAGPVALVLDDVQWGDRPSLQFIDAALRNLSDRPLLVLALARPEVTELFPGLWADRSITELKLTALGKKASEKLVRAVLGDDAGAATIDRIVQLAGGDAFYLEELIRAVAEGKGESLPDTVLAMVEQRLAGLDARKRRVLRAASVFGGVFWAGGVTALLGDGERAAAVADALADLAARELIARRPVTKFAGQDEYGFRQTLVREAAYAMLTDHDRRLGHRLAGEWLERAGEGDPAVVAEHFERAGEPERALSSYRRAAAQALEGNDLDQALSFTERAIARIGDTSQRAPDDPVLAALGAIHLLQAEARRWRDDLALAEPGAAEAMRLLPRGSAPWFLAVGDRAALTARLGRDADLDRLAAEILSLWQPAPPSAQVLAAARAATFLMLRGNYVRADELLDRIREVEELVTELGARARVDQAVSARAMVSGDLGVHRARTASAVARFSEAGDQRNACLARATLAFADASAGRYEEAVQGLREALATAERMGLSSIAGYAKHALGYALARLGETEEALVIERAAVEAFEAIPDRRLEGGSRTYLAAILAQAGDLEAADHEVTLALAALGDLPPVRAYALATRARIRRAKGDATAALADGEAAYTLLRELGGIEEGEALVRLAYAEALDAAGRRDDAAAVIAEARRRLLSRAGRIGDEGVREGFLRAVAENARTLELADAWVGEE